MKTATKKVAKTTSEVTATPEYNEFGVCVACQGGNPDCLHNNLVDNAGTITCVTCGKCMSCPD